MSSSAWFFRSVGGLIGLLAYGVGSLADDKAMRAGLSRLAKEAAVEALEPLTFTIDEPRFRGTLSPIDVREGLDLDLSRVELAEDQVAVDLQFSVLLGIAGQFTLTPESEPADCRSRVRIRVALKTLAPLQLNEGSVVLKPEVSEMRAVFMVEEIVPDSLVSAEQLTTIVNGLFEQRRAELIERVNQVVLDHPVGSVAFMEVNGEGENPLLRGLLARALHDELSKHGNRESGWNNHHRDEGGGFLRTFTEVNSWFWLDHPARNLIVAVPKFELGDGQLAFRAEVRGPVAARIHSKSGVAGNAVLDNKVTVTANANVAIEGAFLIGERGPENVQVHDLKTEISRLRSPAVLVDWLHPLATAQINAALRERHEDLKRDLAQTLGKIRW